MTALLLALHLVCAQTAETPREQVDVAPPAGASESPRRNAIRGFHGMASLDGVVGSSTFAYAYSRSVVSRLSLDARYGFAAGAVPLAVGVRTGVSAELAAVSSVDGGRFGFGGLGLMLVSPELLSVEGGKYFFTPSLRIEAASLLSGTFAASTQLRGDARWEQFRAAVMLNGSAEKEFATQPRALPCGAAGCARPALGGIGLFARGEWRPNEELSAGAGLGVNTLLRSPLGPAGFPGSSPGLTTSFGTATELYLAYRFGPTFGAAFAINSAGPLYTSDNKAVRVPIAEFFSPGSGSVNTLTVSVFARTHDIIEPRWFAP